MFDHPAVIGILIGLPSVALGFLVYRNSKKADQAATAAGTVGAMYEGFDKIIANLQSDNADLRARLGKIDVLEAEVRECLNRIARLERYITEEGGTIPNGEEEREE